MRSNLVVMSRYILEDIPCGATYCYFVDVSCPTLARTRTGIGGLSQNFEHILPEFHTLGPDYMLLSLPGELKSLQVDDGATNLPQGNPDAAVALAAEFAKKYDLLASEFDDAQRRLKDATKELEELRNSWKDECAKSSYLKTQASALWQSNFRFQNQNSLLVAVLSKERAKSSDYGLEVINLTNKLDAARERLSLFIVD